MENNKSMILIMFNILNINCSYITNKGTIIYSNGDILIEEDYVSLDNMIIPISKLTNIQKNKLLEKPIKPTIPIHKYKLVYEKIEGFRYKQPVEYIDNKTYFEYPIDSYVRNNWAKIKYENNNYNKNLQEYEYKFKKYIEYSNNIKL